MALRHALRFWTALALLCGALVLPAQFPEQALAQPPTALMDDWSFCSVWPEYRAILQRAFSHFWVTWLGLPIWERKLRDSTR